MTRERFRTLTVAQAASCLLPTLEGHPESMRVTQALRDGDWPHPQNSDFHGLPVRLASIMELRPQVAASWIAALAGVHPQRHEIVHRLVAMRDAHVIEVIDAILADLDQLTKEET